MNSRPNKRESFELPALPKNVLSKDRQLIDLTTNTWEMRASQDGGRILQINWYILVRAIEPFSLSASSLHQIRLYLARRIQLSKAHTVRNDFEMFRRFFRWLANSNYIARKQAFQWNLLTHAIFKLFLLHGMTTANRGNDFARLRDFYSWGAFLVEFQNFDKQLALSLKKVRAKGNIKGDAVRSHDPIKGPFDPEERDSLIDCFRRRLGQPRDLAVTMFHFELGPNPNSTVRTRNTDFHKFELNVVEERGPRHYIRYQVDLPRVKKRTEHRETVPRPLSDELGRLLETLKSPRNDAYLFHWLDREDPERDINRSMKRFADEVNLVSRRTGKRLNLNARRFRYALGTEMASLGASRAKIAVNLDHTDTQNVDVYVKTTSDVTNHLNDAYEDRLAPIAARFRGKVINKDTKSTRYGATIPATSSLFPILNVGGIGMCGRDLRADGLCQLAPPLTCYGCNFFAAFREGPHAEVLDALQKIRQSLTGDSDQRISMQLDPVIARVIDLIGQIGAEGKGGAHDNSRF